MFEDIKQTLYILKKRYGKTVKIIRRVEGARDYTTGAKGDGELNYTIKKVIRLPENKIRADLKLLFDQFQTGASADIGTREFIIDAREITIEPEIDDIIVFESQNYVIKTIEQLENKLGYLVKGLKTEGDV